MPNRTIAHALVRWTDPDGTRRVGYHGDTVTVPDGVAARHARSGAFVEPDAENTSASSQALPGDGAVTSGRGPQQPEHSISASALKFPAPPARTSPKEAWATYVTDLHKASGGAFGFDKATAATHSRQELIEKIEEQLTAQHRTEN